MRPSDLLGTLPILLPPVSGLLSSLVFVVGFFIFVPSSFDISKRWAFVVFRVFVPFGDDPGKSVRPREIQAIRPGWNVMNTLERRPREVPKGQRCT